MTVSISDRLTSIEKDVNRILEELQNAVTIEDASKYVDVTDSEVESILYRVTSLESKIQSLKYKWQLAHRKVNS